MFNVQRQAAGHKLLTSIPGSPPPAPSHVLHSSRGGCPTVFRTNAGHKLCFQWNPRDHTKRSRPRRQRQRHSSRSTRFLSPAISCTRSCKWTKYIVLCSLATPPLFFIHTVDGCYCQRWSTSKLWPFLETGNKTERNSGYSKHRRLSTHLDVELPTFKLSRIPQVAPSYLPSFIVFHTFAALPWKLQQTFFVSRGFRIGHSSLVQISKYYNTVSRLYSRFSFYGHRWVPQLATS